MKFVTKALSASLFALTLIAGTAAITGCNTMHGAGKDIENAGEGIKDAAK
ncbi:MAG TPA: entericidin A/B family lipoprotein [Humisphaera sp.]